MRKTIFEFAKTIIIALIIALAITFIPLSFIEAQPTTLQSMNKIPYLTNDPKYGDIIVFKAHLYSDNGEAMDLIKRVIGVAGDTIEVKDGLLIATEKR